MVEELNIYSQTESPGIPVWQAVAMFWQQQQQKFGITEMHITTPFCSVLFIKYRFRSSELLFVWILDCRESNNSANCA